MKYFLPARLPRLIAYMCCLLFVACSRDGEKSIPPNPYPNVNGKTPADSLRALLKIAGEDTFRAKALTKLAWLLQRSDPDTCTVLCREAIGLNEKLGYKKGLASAYYYLSLAYRALGDYKKTLAYNDTALAIDREIGDTLGICGATTNLSAVYFTQGDYPRALEGFYRVLKISEALHDTMRIAVTLGNIASVYIKQAEYKDAEKSYAAALVLNKKRHSQASVSNNLFGLGNVAIGTKDGKRALEYLRQALEIDLAEKDKLGLIRTYGSIGNAWDILAGQQKDSAQASIYSDSAIANYNRALALSEELKVPEDMVMNLGNLAGNYLRRRAYPEAEKLLIRAAALSDSLHLRDQKSDDEFYLSQLYDSLGDYKSALRHYQAHIVARDSLRNESKTKESLRTEMDFEYEKQRAVEQEKSNTALERERLIRNMSMLGGVLLLIVAGVSLRAYRQKKRSGEIISDQKQEVELQKALVEEKQKEIIDSINYAKRIQSAILPATGEIENVFPEAFVLFLPKDIVSGDFYWMAQTPEFIFIAAADCTGHGVPGGFMSMLGNALLNEVVLEKKITNPAEALDMLRVKIILALKQKGESAESKDGMDMVLCRFSRDYKRLAFACANNPLWVCRDKTMTEFKPDKQPVGIGGSDAKQFTSQETTLEPGDCVYLLSDGYADQFGGPKGKKFKYKPLQEMLAANSGLPMDTQKEKVSTAFESWKGSLEQVDDVLLIGIKVS